MELEALELERDFILPRPQERPFHTRNSNVSLKTEERERATVARRTCRGGPSSQPRQTLQCRYTISLSSPSCFCTSTTYQQVVSRTTRVTRGLAPLRFHSFRYITRAPTLPFAAHALAPPLLPTSDSRSWNSLVKR